jgi:hypothetical protein
MDNKEICICAAVKDEDGYIWIGHRHCDCISLMTEVGKMPCTTSVQGFVTSFNRFVDRFDGYKLQIAAGIMSKDKDGYRGERLFSEDLY